MSQFFEQLLKIQKRKKSVLCVGLDPHIDKLPSDFKGKPEMVFDFLKAIVDSTHMYACCFKPQMAYFAAYGLEETLFKIIQYIHIQYPETFVILDGKRNDIGSTAEMYAKEAFVRYHADALTVNPYMGGDTIEPFTKFKDKAVFVLCRTSNEGATEFQNITVGDGEALYSFVAKKAIEKWNKNENVGLVVGATAINELRKIRSHTPEAWFLVPGIGAQGGDLASVLEYGRRVDGQGGLIINAARSILYAGSGSDFGDKAKEAAYKMHEQMAKLF